MAAIAITTDGVKITELPESGPATFADLACIVQASISTKQTLSQTFSLFLSNTLLFYAGDPNGILPGVTSQLCLNSQNNSLFICTASGDAVTAVWTKVIASDPFAVTTLNADDGRDNHLAIWSGDQVLKDSSPIIASSDGNLVNIANIEVDGGAEFRGNFQAYGNAFIDGNAVIGGLLTTAEYFGDPAIELVGTINTGAWEATPVNIPFGGTNASNKTSAFNNLSPATTAGDLIAFNGTNNVRLPIGADTYILAVNLSEPTKLTWVPSPSTEGGGTVTEILTTADITVNGTPSSSLVTTGTLGLAPTTVVADTYDFSTNIYSLTVDANGRITALTELTEDEIPLVPLIANNNLSDVPDKPTARAVLGVRPTADVGTPGDVIAADYEYIQILYGLSVSATFAGSGFAAKAPTPLGFPYVYNMCSMVGTSGQINVSNGDGVFGNPTFSLPDVIYMDGIAVKTSGGSQVLAFGNRVSSPNSNYFAIANAVSERNPIINSIGTDANISVEFAGKGSGSVLASISSTSTQARIGVKDFLNTTIGNFGTGLETTFASQIWNEFNVPLVTTVEDSYTATYNNGTAGVGATLTNSGTQETFKIYNGSVFPAVGVQVLITTMANAAYNGLYAVTNTGSPSTNWVLTRLPTYDEVAPGKITSNTLVNVEVNSSSYLLTGFAPTVVGTSLLIFQLVANYSMQLPPSLPPGGSSFIWNAAGYFEWQAPILLNGFPYNLPNSQGAIGQTLVNDGSGNMSWLTPLPISGGTMTGTLILAGNPINAFDAATKQYVDTLLGGDPIITVGAAIAIATVPVIAAGAAAGTTIYLNGDAGVGATIESTVDGPLVIDGVEAQVGDTVVVAGEQVVTTPGVEPLGATANGVYTVGVAGGIGAGFVLVRAMLSGLTNGFTFDITSGVLWALTAWTVHYIPDLVIGITDIFFVQTSNEGGYTAGTGINITALAISVVDGIPNSLTGYNSEGKFSTILPVNGLHVANNILALNDIIAGREAIYPSSLTVNNKGQITAIGNSTPPLIAANNLSDVVSKEESRVNLELVPGTNIQAYSPALQAISNNTSVVGGLISWNPTNGTARFNTITSSDGSLIVSRGDGLSGNPDIRVNTQKPSPSGHFIVATKYCSGASSLDFTTTAYPGIEDYQNFVFMFVGINGNASVSQPYLQMVYDLQYTDGGPFTVLNQPVVLVSQGGVQGIPPSPLSLRGWYGTMRVTSMFQNGLYVPGPQPAIVSSVAQISANGLTLNSGSGGAVLTQSFFNLGTNPPLQAMFLSQDNIKGYRFKLLTQAGTTQVPFGNTYGYIAMIGY